MTKQVRRGMLCAWLAVSMAAAAEPMPDGPYRVGYFQVLLDRPGLPPYQVHRAVVNVFYPVEPVAVTSTTARPIFRVAPGVNARVIPGDRFDRFGFTRSYAGVPVAPGAFPLFVFSAGYGTGWVHSVFLAPRVASYGYVVATLGHLPEGDLGIAERMIERDGDIGLTVDLLLQRSATAGDLLYGAIDGERLILGGFSLGGYNAMARAGGDDLVCDRVQPPIWEVAAPDSTCVPISADPRVKALVLLDASNQMLKFRELARIEVPAMALGEDFDSLTYAYGAIFAPWQARQHAALGGEPSYRVGIKRSHHGMFTNVCQTVEVLCELGYYVPQSLCGDFWRGNRCHATEFEDRLLVLDVISKYVIAFLETELRGVTGYQQILTPGYALTRQPEVDFFVTEPRNPNASVDGEYWFFPYQPGSTVFRADEDQAVTFSPPLVAD